jgi:hypothetical protein
MFHTILVLNRFKLSYNSEYYLKVPVFVTVVISGIYDSSPCYEMLQANYAESNVSLETIYSDKFSWTASVPLDKYQDNISN